MAYSKYGARKQEVDGFVFDSIAEATWYQGLRLLERAGEIKNLELQPKFDVIVNGKHICNYFADFRYIDTQTGETIVEDVKGVRTDVYIIKKKLVEAIYKIKIHEVVKGVRK